jgi:hypothetical protein
LKVDWFTERDDSNRALVEIGIQPTFAVSILRGSREKETPPSTIPKYLCDEDLELFLKDYPIQGSKD